MRICLLLLVLLSAWPSPLIAEDPIRRLEEHVNSFTLENGMRVLHYHRPLAPVFTGQIWVRVGGVDEPQGQTGLAHFLEHMAFKGTKTVGTKDYEAERKLLEELDAIEASRARDQNILELPAYQEVQQKLQGLWIDNHFADLYRKQGAVGLNAGTSSDYTVYLVNLPSSAFEFWCWLESDRLLNPVFRQFYKEREVVLEERRSRIDDNPEGQVYEALLASAYWNHPAGRPIAGWREEVSQLNADQMEAFYNKHYRADNMTIVLVGGLELSEIRPMLEKYFGRYPKPEGPRPQMTIVEPPQRGERIVKVDFDAEPFVMLAWHKPAYPAEDEFYFTILHEVLSRGRSSILERELVRKKRIATSVFSSEYPGERFPPVFALGGTPAKNVSSDRLKDELQRVMDRLKVEPLDEETLAAAKRRVKAMLIKTMSSNYGLARMLGRAETNFDDWRATFRYYDKVLETSAEDIQRIVTRYFDVGNRTYAAIAD